MIPTLFQVFGNPWLSSCTYMFNLIRVKRDFQRKTLF